MSASTLFFLRHGETARAGTFCGRSDPPLNDAGRAQAHALSERLRAEPISSVYSSPRLRAVETAAFLAPTDSEITIRPALAEIDFGQWEGLTWSQIEALDPPYSLRWAAAFPTLAAPDGESFASFKSRVLDEIAWLRRAGEGKVIATVTHAGVLRVLGEEIGGWTAAQAWERTREYGCILRCTQDSSDSPPHITLE